MPANRVPLDTTKRYVMLNKPTGVVSTLADENGRRDLTEFTNQFDERLYNVGRLDAVPRKNATALLQLAPGFFLTNEGGDGHAERIYLRGFDARVVYHDEHRADPEKGAQRPEGHRHGLLQVAAADHRRVAVCLREVGHRRRDCGQLLVDDRERLADLPEQAALPPDDETGGRSRHGFLPAETWMSPPGCLAARNDRTENKCPCAGPCGHGSKRGCRAHGRLDRGHAFATLWRGVPRVRR